MTGLVDHLCLEQTQIPPGGERTWSAQEWTFIRVCTGTGYYSSRDGVLELNAGDLLVIPAESSCRLRASRLGSLVLCQYHLQPRKLMGFFSLEEQRGLEAFARAPGARPWRVASDAPLAQRFSGLCQLRSSSATAVLRGETLLLALRLLPDDLTPSPGCLEQPDRPIDRLRRVIGGITEDGLRTASARELARKCGCGERHFRRLFSRCYGKSLVRHQMRLRINLAKRLLEETDAKVTDVALECGFQHFGLFSSLFKRSTGSTPSQWRARKIAETPRRIRSVHRPCPPTPGAR